MKHTFALSVLFSLLLLSNATDITQMLNQYPDFSNFNTYLTQTNLAAEVNSRQTITVLVVDNGAISSLSAKPLDQLKNILSVHIILDYYDVPKLQQLSGNSALLTTLFQSTGSALGQQGFLNVTRLPSGSIAFGSAMPGSPLGSNLVESVVSQPYNISVVQISNPIIPQGIDGAKVSAPPSTTPTATAATPLASAATPPQPQSATATALPPSSVIPPAISQLITPATAPPQPSAATVPTTAPPTPATASAPPTSTNTPVPSTATPTSAPTTAAGPKTATTPSTSPASTPGPAMGPAAEAPTLLEEPAGTTPVEPKPKGKNSCTALDAGLALLSTITISTLYLASTI